MNVPETVGTLGLDESFLGFRETAIRWVELSERAYLNARSLRFPYADLG